MPNFPDPTSIQPTPEGLKISFNKKYFFEALIRTAFDTVKGSLSAGTLPAWTKVIEKTITKEGEAFHLLSQSLIDALCDQIQQEIDQAHLDEQKQLVVKKKILNATAFDLLKTEDYNFRMEHFSRPETLSLLRDFSKAYKTWLQESFGMSNSRAQGLAATFKYHFGYAFYEELKKRDYPQLNKWRTDPMLPEQVQLIRRQRYEAQLQEHYYAPSLGQQDVALADIYIEPNFLVLDKMLSEEKIRELHKKNRTNHQEHFISTEFEYSIHDYFRQYFLQKRNSPYLDCPQECSRMMILLGQPGHGKSSFCYRTAHELLNSNEYHGSVHLVRLRDTRADVIQYPLDEFARILEKKGLKPAVDWSNQESPSLLLLDGLDELYMSRGLKEEEVREFLRACKLAVEDHPNLFIVITSRFNYLQSDKFRIEKALVLSLATLDHTQQERLIQRYQAQGRVVNIDLELLEEINYQDNYEHIRELIELPIILQIILLSEIDLQVITSRAAIYDILFERVLKRKWDEAGPLKIYRNENDFKPQHLRAYLSFIALKIYQAPYDYLNRTQITSYRETRAFIQEYLTIGSASGPIDDALKDVLTSFYIKERRKDEYDEGIEDRNQYAIEFLHKSLYEYLACEYIWIQIQDIFSVRHPDFFSVGPQLQSLLGKTRLSVEMITYLQEIIDRDIVKHEELQIKMANVLPELLAYGCIYQHVLPENSKPPYYTPTQEAYHILHVYWVILGQLRVHRINIDEYWNTTWSTFYQQHLMHLDINTFIESFNLPHPYGSKSTFLVDWSNWHH
ncbi:MAG: NACHT domain-containing protein, partial [Cyanobacteria bacterium J06649_11]